MRLQLVVKTLQGSPFFRFAYHEMKREDSVKFPPFLETDMSRENPRAADMEFSFLLSFLSARNCPWTVVIIYGVAVVLSSFMTRGDFYETLP